MSCRASKCEALLKQSRSQDIGRQTICELRLQRIPRQLTPDRMLGADDAFQEALPGYHNDVIL